MAEVVLAHRTIADLSKEPANIPTGVWQLRGIKLSVKSVTKKTRDGEEYDTNEFTLTLEPVSPTASVNPEELAEKDPNTGKPVYDGKRVFQRFVESFRTDMKDMGAALTAMGLSGDLGTIIEKNSVRGKVVFGELFNRHYTRNDKSEGIEQRVRAWGSASAAAGGTKGSSFKL